MSLLNWNLSFPHSWTSTPGPAAHRHFSTNSRVRPEAAKLHMHLQQKHDTQTFTKGTWKCFGPSKHQWTVCFQHGHRRIWDLLLRVVSSDCYTEQWPVLSHCQSLMSLPSWYGHAPFCSVLGFSINGLMTWRMCSYIVNSEGSLPDSQTLILAPQVSRTKPTQLNKKCFS